MTNLEDDLVRPNDRVDRLQLPRQWLRPESLPGPRLVCAWEEISDSNCKPHGNRSPRALQSNLR
jgi:hypothetical protein